MQIWYHWSTPISAASLDQIGCGSTWQIYLSLEANTRATGEIPTLNQSWRGCNHPTSNWPYQGHQVPYFVQGTPDHLLSLWSDTDHWPYAPRVCSVTGKAWRILHSWVTEYSLWGNSWDLHRRIPLLEGILLSDMNRQICYTPPHLNHPWTDAMSENQLVLWPGQYGRAWSVCSENESSYERHLLV